MQKWEAFVAVLFPTTFTRISVILLSFLAALLSMTVPWGLGYGRFLVRALDCYDEDTYYKFPESVTKDHPHCQVFTYPYRLVTPWVGSRFLPWFGYLVHQLGQWYIMRQSQLARDRGEISWEPLTVVPTSYGMDRSLHDISV